MTYLYFILKSALEDFRRNKVRTLLTSLGILIGVSSVVLLMAFGLGLKKYITDQFESLGANLLIIFPGKLIQNGQFRQGPGGLGGKRFDEKDVLKLAKIKTAQYVVPAFTKTVEVSGGSNTETADIYATTNDIFIIRNLDLDLGSYFTATDNDKRSKYAVLGPKIAEKLFGTKESALERSVKIDNQGFKVVGVLKSKGGGGFGGPDLDSFLYIPYKTSYSFNPDKKFIAVNIKVDRQENIALTKEQVKKIMLGRYSEDDFSVIEATEILNAVSSIFAIMNAVLVAIAAISLIVGGIGIMNIMYVSVVERTKEIGIRRAVGATRSDILYQFLIESVILSLVGGLLGLLISYLVVLLAQKIFPAYIDLQSILIALGVSSLIGIVFGVFPARKASLLSPIDAIRYE